MAYEKECKNCGKTIEISNDVKTKGSWMDDDGRVYEATDIEGNTIYKTEISMTMGNLHDTSTYLCSRDCYETYAVVEEL